MVRSLFFKFQIAGEGIDFEVVIFRRR